MCNINMKGCKSSSSDNNGHSINKSVTASAAGGGGGEGGGREETINRPAQVHKHSSSMTSPSPLRSAEATEAPTTTTEQRRIAQVVGRRRSRKDQQKDIRKATMYEINTCPGDIMNNNNNSNDPVNKFTTSSSSSGSSSPFGQSSTSTTTATTTIAGQKISEGEGGEEEGGDEEADGSFFHGLLPRKLWQLLFCSASSSSVSKTTLAMSRCRSSKSSSSSSSTPPPARTCSTAAAAVERCDENLNQFYVVLVLVTCVCYINGLNGDFVHDDIPAITMNKDVLALNPAATLFKNDFWGTAMSDVSSHKSYRPLTTLSFRFNYLLFGMRPQWFHLTNILLHAAVCVLFTRICFCVAGLEKQFALIAGIIFAMHPIHSEAVTGIVGRADVLACLFFLLSLLLYHGHSTNPTRHKFWLSIACGGLSMLAKETGITVLMVNITYDGYKMWQRQQQQQKPTTTPYTDVRWWLPTTTWSKETRQFISRISQSLLFIVIFCAVRIAIGGSLPKFSQQDNPAAYHPCIVTRFLTFSYLAAFNWWLMLAPTQLSHDWQMSSIPLITVWSDARNLLTVLIVVLLIGLVARSLCDFKRQSHSSLLLGLLMLTVPFLPASNIIVTVGFVVAERVLYIPSLGSILLTVYGMQLMWRQSRSSSSPANGGGRPMLWKCWHGQSILRSLVVLLFISNGLKTVHRNDDWMSRESLLRSGLKVLPHNAKMHYNFGNFLRDTSKIALAMHHYHIALELWPTYSSAHNNLGTLVRDARQAEFHFLAAIRYSEGHLNAHFNLGQLYKRTNRTHQACQMLEKCIEMDPKFIPGYIELFKLKRGKAAEGLLREMATIATKDQSILFMFGKWLMMHDYHLKAFNVFVRAFTVDTFHQVGFLSYLKACQNLRHLGQTSRLLQLVLRFHLLQQQKLGKKGYQPNIYLREWAIKTELKYRARIYDPQEQDEHKSIPAPDSSASNDDDDGGTMAAREEEGERIHRQQQQQQQKAINNGDASSSREDDNNKSSLAQFSNQMDQKNFRLKFHHLNHKTCNITKWLYPIVKEKRLLGPVQSQFVLLEQILHNTQINEKSVQNQRCIGSILKHLRMTRKLKLHHNNLVPYLMANLWDNL